MVKILYPLQASWLDYPDNSNLAVVVCFMGCDNGCYKCQNPDFQNPQYDNGTCLFTPEMLEDKLKEVCRRNHTNKVVLSGGDPLAYCNIDFTKEFLEKTSFDVCVYTGHDIEYVKEHFVKGFKFIKCGKFDFNNLRESVKTDDYIQFASPNQCLYDGEYNILSENGIYKF